MKGEVWLSGSALIYRVGYSQHHKKKGERKKGKRGDKEGGVECILDGLSVTR